ncbi:amidase [Nonomuraea longicatena]|uniref:Putative amidase n=1 Tax=Nonomuraea longicatena TaxID=83682 RepID=C9W331_9ACTN|nr:putative amidase [Nonomuraea longicatena]
MLWAGKSAVEIAAAVRAGEVTPATVMADHLRVITEREPRVSAFRLVRKQAIDEARAVGARGDLARLPLAGVPVAVKDNLAVAGETPRHGSAAVGTARAAADHPAVARLRAAGAVIVGLTNMPELGLVGFGDSAFGTVRNPWSPARTAGGSSSGSAAAVSAGMVPIALGNDGMGSLRIPAACCGVLAVKPGPGLVPPPDDDWAGLTENGPLAWNIADLSLALSVLAATPALATAWRDGSRSLRVAYAPQPLPFGLPMDPQFRAAVRAAAATLRRAGHTTTRHRRRMPQWLGLSTAAFWLSRAAAAVDTADASDLKPEDPDTMRAAAQVTALGARGTALDSGQDLGKGPAQDIGAGAVHGSARTVTVRVLERRTRALARAGRILRTLGLDGAKGRERWRSQAADDWFADADVILTPTLAAPPPNAARWGERGLIRNLLANASYAPVTGMWNMSGWPALSVPIATHTTGVPISVQLIARPGSDHLLLALAAHLTDAHPPVRAPGYSL